MTRHYRLAGAAVVGALLVAGCSDGAPIAEASVAPTLASPTASPSPSATAVMVAPQRPAAMDDDGQAGAKAAVLYFLSMDPYMQTTGDTTEWEAFSHETCGYCAERLEQARQLAAERSTWTGGDLAVTITNEYAQDVALGIWPFDVSVIQSPATVIDAQGTSIAEVGGGSVERRVEVARRDGDWVLIEVARIPEH